MRRTLAAMVLTMAVLAGSGGLAPSPAAGGGPPETFNEFFQSIPISVGGTYQPLVGGLDCRGPGDGRFGIFWYAPGAAADSLWYDFEGVDSVSYKTTGAQVSGTYRPIVGDFDGDGCDDILWHGPGSAPDSIWYSQPGLTWDVRSLSISGDYTPILIDAGDDGPDDIYFYGQAGGTESIWTGTTTRGTFTSHAAPQVQGSGYRTATVLSGILFHRPGPGGDSLWFGIEAGASAPALNLPVTVNGAYEGHPGAGGILLYGPGAAPDQFVYDFDESGLITAGGSINGTYRVGSSPYFSVFVFHGPGTAPDSIWVGGATAATSSFEPAAASGFGR